MIVSSLYSSNFDIIFKSLLRSMIQPAPMFMGHSPLEVLHEKESFFGLKCVEDAVHYIALLGNLSAHKDFKGSEDSPREGKNS